MDYDIRWHDTEKSIIYCLYPKGWTWDDLHLIADKCRQMTDAESSAPRVDVISDLANGIVPRGSAVSHSESIMRNKHPRIGLVVVIIQNSLMVTLSKMTLRLSVVTRENYRIVSNMEEALALIQTERRQETP